LTVGLPVYNGADYLAASLDALLGQTYQDFELVISDNASSDSTADICHQYASEDPRIRYFRQTHNIGCAPNHNFVIKQAKGELFKTASHDDLYAPELLERCVRALDEHPDVVLAHSWSAVIGPSGEVSERLDYPVNTGSAYAPERLRSMLFDGWGDDEGGVVRIDVLRRTPLHGSYHFADRTFTIELALHGPFYMVPDWLYFRRHHPDQAGRSSTVRARCTNLDPRRANRLRHPGARLYGEYIWAYHTAIRRAPLSADERRLCYRILHRWMAGRLAPVARRSISGHGLSESALNPSPPAPGGLEAVLSRTDTSYL
jgi:glycosyltransferase involved in cell wall biosynthesis